VIGRSLHTRCRLLAQQCSTTARRQPGRRNDAVKVGRAPTRLDQHCGSNGFAPPLHRNVPYCWLSHIVHTCANICEVDAAAWISLAPLGCCVFPRRPSLTTRATRLAAAHRSHTGPTRVHPPRGISLLLLAGCSPLIRVQATPRLDTAGYTNACTIASASWRRAHSG
jgi:hypothetical protein